MPGVTRAHGYAGAGEFVGRDLYFKIFTQDSGVMTQEDLDALVQAVQLRATVEVIGEFSEDSPGQDNVRMVLSGFDVTTVSGYTITDVTGF